MELKLVESLPCLTSLDLSGTAALESHLNVMRVLPPDMREIKMAHMLPGHRVSIKQHIGKGATVAMCS